MFRVLQEVCKSKEFRKLSSKHISYLLWDAEQDVVKWYFMFGSPAFRTVPLSRLYFISGAFGRIRTYLALYGDCFVLRKSCSGSDVPF